MPKLPSPEMITAISAVVVGVAALGVGIMQARIAYKQSQIMQESIRASVWPVLQAEQTAELRESGASIALSLKNAGVGPAMIYGVSLSQDGKPIGSLQEFAVLAPEILTMRNVTVSQSTVAGRILAAGDEISFAAASWTFEEPLAPETAALFNTSFAKLNSVRIEACYCSATQSCWLAASDDRKPPTEIESCEAGGYGEF